MVKLNIIQLLEKEGKSKYWLYNQIGMNHYKNFNNLINNETISIKFEYIDKLCDIFNCEIQDLFIREK